MKHLVIFIVFSELMLAAIPEPPFRRGVNFSNWFQVIRSASELSFTRYSRKDMESIKSLGCDHIRLPLELYHLSGPAPDYTLDPLFLRFLDQVVNWAEELDLYLILDNHSFDPAVDTGLDILDPLIPFWTQLAARYANRSGLICYEILNEPHGITDTIWNQKQQQVIDAIRAVDTVHTIVIGPANWNSYANIRFMPAYDDPNLILTFHFYDPFLFTHQGASWTDPSLEHVTGIPFPYDAARMPAMPAEYEGTWVGDAYAQYSSFGNANYLRSSITTTIQFAQKMELPLWVGEFGAYMPNSTTEDRARWHQAIRELLEANQIAWTLWDFYYDFGIFEPGSSRRFDSDLTLPVIEALGLTPPPQVPFVLKPDSTGFNIFNDYPGEKMTFGTWLGSATVNFYSENMPLSGDFCLSWADAAQYDEVKILFSPEKDMSYLFDQDFRLEFWVKGSTKGTYFDVRFMDTDTADPEDHPWRAIYTIDSRLVDWDDTWQRVDVPLSDFWEQGAWEDEWFNPQGDFDWSHIQSFDLSAPDAMTDIEVSFDDIRVIGDTGSAIQHCEAQAKSFQLIPAYPNPFNEETMIWYYLARENQVRIRLLDIRGREIRLLTDARQRAGTHQIRLNATGLSSGMYLVDVSTGDQMKRQKVMLVK